MDRIQEQASKLWDILFSDDTAATYQKALDLTGTLLKESAQLIWLIICSVFVFGAWFGDASIKTGKSIRTWVDQQGSPKDASLPQKSMADTANSLLASGRSGAAYLIAQAREQLGLEPVEPAAIAPAPKRSSAPPAAKPAARPAVTSSPSPASAAPASVAPAAAPVAAEEEEEEEEWPPKAAD